MGCALSLSVLAACDSEEGGSESGANSEAAVSFRSAVVRARSLQPPAGLSPNQVPQFVAVSFDDNFSSEGMDWATSFHRNRTNPPGAGNAATFDGTPIRTTFFHNSSYLAGRQAAWQTAVDDGHELANHTVNHPHGLNFTRAQWDNALAPSRSQLSSALGVPEGEVVGFRAPFLEYNDALYTSLAQAQPSYRYDSSIQSCWADAEGPGTCPWPYTLDAGSVDAQTVIDKFGSAVARPVGNHPGVWNIPVPALEVPPDALASQYGFTAGLRGRIETALAHGPAPSFYDPATARVASLDVTLLVDAKLYANEVSAILRYNLDAHLAGNRSPLVYVAHTHVYDSGYGAATNVQDVGERRAIIEDFLDYALEHPDVRIRPTDDLVDWLENPAALGVCVPSCDGRVCGSDGCGGSCGTCDAGEVCSVGQCVPDQCEPSCDGKSCGPDGCGGECGQCPVGQTCDAAGQCHGDDPGDCGGLPSWQLGGSYAENQEVHNQGDRYTCKPWPFTGWCGQAAYEPGVGFAWQDAWSQVGSCGSCTPQCQGRECGGDGCGGSCGSCNGDDVCDAGQCVPPICEPQCQGRECGDDACGGSCGSCSGDDVCDAGQCVPPICEPQCQGRECGNDGCGGSCGSCSGDDVCDAGQCVPPVCEPQCAGLACGDDGCGGQCGTCSGGKTCSGGQCVGGDGCNGVPAWQAGTGYDEGQEVSSAGARYSCKPWPFTGWCGQSAYEPGVGFAWQDAWDFVADCP